MDVSAGDVLTLLSPTGQAYASDTCTTCTADGLEHTLALDVPCEPGYWHYTVSSEEEFGTNRESSVDSFFVAPTVALVGSWPITAGTWHTCPGGDGAFFTTSLEYDESCVTTIAATRMTVEALPVSSSNMAFFPQDVAEAADSAATVDNDYSTTVVEYQIGGCSAESVEVYLDGVEIGKVYASRYPTADLTGTGTVDAGDLAVLASALGTCSGDSAYNPCANIAGYFACIDTGDLSALATHLGHTWTNPLSKAGGGATMTSLSEVPNAPTGAVDVAVDLNGISSRSAVGIVLRPSAALASVQWLPAEPYAASTILVDTLDVQGRRLVLLATSVAPTAAGSITLGKLRFANAAAFHLSDLTVGYEDAYAYGPGIESSMEPPIVSETSPTATRLHANYPNPCNPSTTIHFDLAHPGRVTLRIYDVTGRVVRVLLDDQLAAERNHTVTWDGRDSQGRGLASGVYAYRLEADNATLTRKLVLMK